MITQVLPWLDDAELASVTDSIKGNWLTEGPKCAEAIEKLESLLGVQHVTFAPNGTLGLFLALVALDLPKGSKVLVPDFTFFGSCSSIVMAGLIPVSVDVDINTYQMDLNDMRDKYDDSVSAIMPVHIYGQGANICEIIEFARRKKLKVIEDAAQVLGVYYSSNEKVCEFNEACCTSQRKHLGTFGDVGVFSLYADKTVTAGEGGIICTNNSELYEKIKLLRNQGRPNSGTFIHPAVGMNFRITDLQGGILSKQLDKLQRIRQQRLDTYSQYCDNLSDKISVMEQVQASDFIPFRMPIRVNNPEMLVNVMEENNIQGRRFFYPMYLQPALREYALAKCANSNLLYDTGVCLPIHGNISLEDVKKICALVNEFGEPLVQ